MGSPPPSSTYEYHTKLVFLGKPLHSFHPLQSACCPLSLAAASPEGPHNCSGHAQLETRRTLLHGQMELHFHENNLNSSCCCCGPIPFTGIMKLRPVWHWMCIYFTSTTPCLPFLMQINCLFHQNCSLSLQVQTLLRIDVSNQLQPLPDAHTFIQNLRLPCSAGQLSNLVYA